MERNILAFVHIKKAAGTTLTHILRINFFLRHCDVRTLSKGSGEVFQSEDMKKLLMINPFITSIAGHEVMPFGNLVKHYPGIRFITLLRDPLERYISQYQYNAEKLGHTLSFEQYLQTPASFNKQTRSIAGTDDLELAKEILINRFFLVGIVEEFDEFLVLLRKKLEPLIKFRPGYRVQNVSRRKSPIRRNIERQLDKYHDLLVERNFLDIELYKYVKDEILPHEKRKYGPNFECDVTQFRRSGKGYSRNLCSYADYILRKCYYNPIIHLIRKRNGLH